MEDLVTFQNLPELFKGKKVFVTGHTGFKGSWLVACLHVLGAKIRGYALEPEYQNSLFSLFEPMNIVQSTIADIRDKDTLTKDIVDFQPDFIFHLAAQPLVRRSYEIPAETFAVNVAGTANLLEAASRLSGKCTIVVITTDKVYENKEVNVLYKEADLLGGYDPYSASKACTELVVNSFRSSFFNPADFRSHEKVLATARAGNVIGGGDWNKDRLVPDIVRALMQGQTIEVRNPASVRPWQHVLEPLFGYLTLAACLDKDPLQHSKAYNFGPSPGDHLTVQELVEKSIESWKTGSWIDASEPGQLHEAGLLKLDIGLAFRDLAWKPKLNAATAIDWSLSWYKQPMSKQADYTFAQINDYLSL